VSAVHSPADPPSGPSTRSVVDLTTSLAGAYATRLLHLAGHHVVVVEPAGGHPLRRWPSAVPGVAPDGDAPLWTWLADGADVRPAEDRTTALADADLVVCEGPAPDGLAEHAVALCVTPFGLTGPWAGRPASDLTLQAWAGSVATRGERERPPLVAGGRLGEYVIGSYAAAAGAAALRRSARTGRGNVVDLSGLECLTASMNLFGNLFASFLGIPVGPTPKPIRGVEVPSIERSADGWVGFTIITPAQTEAFCDLLGHPELAEQPEVMVARKRERNVELREMVREWTAARTTVEVIEEAVARRIPATPVGNGETVQQHPQLEGRGVFVEHPAGFVHPRRPWRFHRPEAPFDADVGPRPAVASGGGEPTEKGDDDQPLSGVRVLDLTAFWAGPSATHLLASLGADVLKVESPTRPDGMRTTSTRPPSDPTWLEWGPIFHGANTNKRSVALDLTSSAGRDLVLRLLERCDLVIENSTPRVLEGFDLSWDVVHGTNPCAVMVRMPAYGLDGPWRERPGFAQTMEEATGLAWVTGWPDRPPLLPRGPVDPLAGMHAVVAVLQALDERDRTGVGLLVEVPLVEVALHVAAEQVITHSATGDLQDHRGNRDRRAAPQGVYACAGTEEWLALTVDDDDQWQALVAALGQPGWTQDPSLATAAGRHEAHDLLDDELAAWCAERPMTQALDLLWSAGVPVAACVSPAEITVNEQLQARGHFEAPEHPVTGTHAIPSLPFRFASRGDEPWLRTAAPTVGQHTDEVLAELLGLDQEQLADLRRRGVTAARRAPA
jgi:crotonobetainyl-CoA:carnitine CoA-transferase CaiB-like acyl-CoA transferase